MSAPPGAAESEDVGSDDDCCMSVDEDEDGRATLASSGVVGVVIGEALGDRLGAAVRRRLSRCHQATVSACQR